MSTIAITPETKVGKLLEAYPASEAALIAIAPQFKALKNPVLRRTVARVATLEQAARVAGMSAKDLVQSLRAELGVEGGAVDEGRVQDRDTGEAPSWVDVDAKAAIDAGALLDAGETPVGVVSRALAGMGAGEVLVVVAPFQPAPMIDSLRSKGHEVYSRADDDGACKVWVRRA
jgi:hypothetical protein